MKILFLYTELADYTIACCHELAKQAEVHIVRWPVNKEAPFQFEFRNLNIYSKQDFDQKTLKEKINSIRPDKIICSGWIDKDYLQIVSTYYKKIPTIIALDTQWRGNLKQRLACLLSRFLILNRFSHAWVPGNRQKEYALKLGFKSQQISVGFYSCDTDRFNAYYEEFKNKKQLNFPKRFLFVGRYYDFKGISELWKAFIELQNESESEWELWCCGTGTISAVEHKKIKHFGFVQPAALKEIISETGVFVLPSNFEPWGVVVHEYASAGYPLLLSNAVGAKEDFLNENENGYSFQSQNVAQLKIALKKIINSSDKELFLMAETSHRLAQAITPNKWVKNLLNMKL